MGGDMVTKTLNDAFGYDGWCLDVKNTTREEPIKDDKGRYHVAYIATVRITHRKSGVYREDCGSGDAIDRSLASASGNALKGAVTDAMKRAAKHFGEKMGNALYHDGFNANNAPPTLKDALNTLDIERAKSRFGFEKDRKVVQQQAVTSSSGVAVQHQTSNAQSSASLVKHEQQKKAHVVVNSYTSNTSNNANNTKSSYAQQQQTPRTQYVGNVVMEHSNMSKAKQTSQPHVTPHHGNSNNNAAAKQQPTNYVTPGNRVAPTTTKKKQSFDPSVFAAVPAEKLQENANPQQSTTTSGLALPPRPGTSYGNGNNNTTATATPSMFGANCTMSQALTIEQQSQSTTANSGSLAQSLKRKSESIDGGVGASSIAAKNPYSQAS